MSEQERYQRARKRVKQLKDFYSHLAVYIAVIGFLAVVNYLTGDFPWVIFPAGGWGIGLFIHAMETFNFGLGAAWEERKIRELMAQEAEMEAAYLGEKPKRMLRDDFFEEEVEEEARL